MKLVYILMLCSILFGTSCKKQTIPPSTFGKETLAIYVANQNINIKKYTLVYDNKIYINIETNDGKHIQLSLGNKIDGVYVFGPEDSYPAYLLLNENNNYCVSKEGSLVLNYIDEGGIKFANATSSLKLKNNQYELIDCKVNFKLKIN